MNYERIYTEIIENAVNRGWTKESAPCYTERHHILPKRAGGTDDESNLVTLTAREHIIAHLVLAKARGGIYWRCASGMLMNGNGYNRANSVSSRTLASIREKHAEHMSDTMKGNTNAAGVVFSDERKKNISNAKKGRFSEKQRRALEKNWDSAKGRKDSDETRKKRSDAMKSNGFVPVKAGDFETCSNAGKANKGVKKSFRSETHIENLKKSLPRGKDHSCAKSLYVDGVSYDTMKSAAEALGITVDAIRYRCKSKSKKFENYQFA